MHSPRGIMKREAVATLPLGRVEVVRSHWDHPIDVVADHAEHHLELCLLPRSDNASGSFPERWGPHRFEPIGELFLLPADERVRARSTCRHQNSIVCHLPSGSLAPWIGPEFQWTDARLRGSLDITSASLRQVMFRLGAEVQAPGVATRELLEAMLLQVAIELSRHLIALGEGRAFGGLAPRTLKILEERFAAEGPPPSLTELADLCRLSVRHLTRAFRISRGRSIGEYIAERRMEHAKELLTAGMSVKSVATALNFAAATNFSSAFRRATGEPPRRYRLRASGQARAAGRASGP